MADIALAWQPLDARGDFAVAGGALATGNDLETAVLISLFSDAVASPDYIGPDGSTDPRGCWIDTYETAAAGGTVLGSLLWQLFRGVKAGNTNLPLQAQNACAVALQWLIADGIAASIQAAAGWVTPTALGIQVVITRPNGSAVQFRYRALWDAFAPPRAPAPGRVVAVIPLSTDDDSLSLGTEGGITIIAD